MTDKKSSVFNMTVGLFCSNLKYNYMSFIKAAIGWWYEGETADHPAESEMDIK